MLIRVGLGSCGVASGALEVKAALDAAVRSLGGGATVKAVGCAGLCHREPLVEVLDGGKRVLYGNVAPADARKLVREHVRPRGIAPRVHAALGDLHSRLTDDNPWLPIASQAIEASPYTARQVRIVLENCGEIDPLSLDDYRAREGFRALEASLSRSPESLIDEIRAAGLRGRGGAGFPTAVKWASRVGRPATTKYVICNGDEGDPGAFMDRMMLESFPYRVIEGMAIAAYAVGAREGILYIRREYPLAVRRVRAAIESATAARPPGRAHPRQRRSASRLQVREGAGAFVCGEETALIASLEGRRGMPRLRPPYPGAVGALGPADAHQQRRDAGLRAVDHPQRRRGLRRARHASSKGTKVFALAGKIARGGLIEVPMGITIRQIVEEIGGGISGRAARSRRCRSAGRPAAASPRRWPTRPSTTRRSRRRRDHGLRRPGRARRPRLHGGHRPLLPAVHAGPVVRQVHVLPHRHAADARHSRPALRRARDGQATSTSWSSWRGT